MYCRILGTTDTGQSEAGRLWLEDGGIVHTVNDGYEVLMGEMADRECFNEEGDEVSSLDEPEEWLRVLPLNLNGSMLRAEYVG